VVISGTGAYWHHGEVGLRRLAETAGLPVYMNGLGRGTLPADHPNAFSRTRSAALGHADLLILIGTPLDFRLNFGQPPLHSDKYKLIRIDALESDLTHNRAADVGIAGNIGRAVSVAVRFDDRPEPRPFERPQERAHVASQSAEVDVDLGAMH